jgi:hypothetical protein
MDTLTDFAKTTRHRERHLENANLVARKLLATQCPKFVDWTRVYHHVSDDLNSINFRAPQVLQNYADTRVIDPEYLQDRMLGSLAAPEQCAVFNHFVETVKPPKGKELATFFVHSHIDKDLAYHLEYMVPNDKTEQQRLHRALKEYQLDPHVTPEEAAKEIGQMIGDMSWDEDMAPVATSFAALEAPDDEKAPLPEPVDDRQELPISDAEQWSAEKEQELANNPVLKAFKIDAGLTQRFPAQKTIHQVMHSCLGEPIDERLHLGKTQTSIPPVDMERQHWDQLVGSYVAHLPAPYVASMVASERAQEFYGALPIEARPTDGRQWARLFLTSKHPKFGSELKLSKRYMKKYGGSH